MTDNADEVIDLTVDQIGDSEHNSVVEEDDPIGVNICFDVVDLLDDDDNKDETNKETPVAPHGTSNFRVKPVKERGESKQCEKTWQRLRRWSLREPGPAEERQPMGDGEAQKQSKHRKRKQKSVEKDMERGQNHTVIRRQRNIKQVPQHQQTGRKNGSPRERLIRKKRHRGKTIDNSSSDRAVNKQDPSFNPAGVEKIAEVVDLLEADSDDDSYVETAEHLVRGALSRKQPQQQERQFTSTATIDANHPSSKQSDMSSTAKQQQRATKPPASGPNFIVIGDDSDDSGVDESYGKHAPFNDDTQKESATTQTAPRKCQVVKEIKPFCEERDYNYAFSREDAAELQDRLLREAAARARSRFASIQTPTGTHNQQNSLDCPLLDIPKRHPNHWKWKNPYACLGLPNQSSTKLVKMHYRKLALLYHPDKAKYPDAAARFHAITTAYKRIME